MFQTLSDLSGRLHPALVHLPIGILVLACLLSFFKTNQPLIRTMFLWGMITAVLSAITGLALANSGQYEEELLTPHKISGIVLAFGGIALYLFYHLQMRPLLLRLGTVVVLAMVVLTGHLGGNLTHGRDFITAPLTQNNAPAPLPPIPDIEHAQVYSQVVQPIFQARCVRCHGEHKQKGDLRLDTQEGIKKGGKSKKTIIPGKPEESALIERLLLPIDDEDHMPPRGKPQLTPEHIALLNWWVSSGVSFDKKVGDIPQPSTLKPTLAALEKGITVPPPPPADAPAEPVNAADTAVLADLRRKGVTIVPLDLKSNYLAANFVTAEQNASKLIPELIPVNKQLVSLLLDGARLPDSSLKVLSKLTTLRRLQLSNTQLSDKDLAALAPLTELRSLNLVGTGVTAKGLAAIKGMKNLQHLYLYKTPIDSSQQAELKQLFPKTRIELGNYSLPMLAGDTTEIKF